MKELIPSVELTDAKMASKDGVEGVIEIIPVAVRIYFICELLWEHRKH